MRWILRAWALMLAVGVGAIIHLAFLRDDSHVIRGSIAVVDTETSSSGDTDGCDGSDVGAGYSDIDTGAEVVVQDGSGRTIGTGRLSRGTWTEFAGIVRACRLDFEVPDIPDSRFYKVLIGNDQRGGKTYSKSELKKQDWRVELTLGP